MSRFHEIKLSCETIIGIIKLYCCFTHRVRFPYDSMDPQGLEPRTRWLWVSCSNRLSYRSDRKTHTGLSECVYTSTHRVCKDFFVFFAFCRIVAYIRPFSAPFALLSCAICVRFRRDECGIICVYLGATRQNPYGVHWGGAFINTPLQETQK